MLKTPELSPLQCLVIECLGQGKVSGRDLRGRLTEQGEKKGGPAFYQLMARMEETGLVEGEYTQKIVEGQIIKERVYRVTGRGEQALSVTYEFYRQLQMEVRPAYV